MIFLLFLHILTPWTHPATDRLRTPELRVEKMVSAECHGHERFVVIGRPTTSIRSRVSTLLV